MKVELQRLREVASGLKEHLRFWSIAWILILFIALIFYITIGLYEHVVLVLAILVLSILNEMMNAELENMSEMTSHLLDLMIRDKATINHLLEEKNRLENYLSEQSKP